MSNYSEFFKDKIVLITGGCGFIGSNLARKLLNLPMRPKKIILVDSLVPGLGGMMENVKDLESEGVELYAGELGDCKDRERMLDILRNESVDCVFNLAGSVSHKGSKENPSFDLECNLLPHVRFLDACRAYVTETGKKLKIGYAGTRDQLGKIPEGFLPVTEDFSIKEVTDPQGIHKQAAEWHHLWYAVNTNGLEVFSLRLTNTYGPRHVMNDPTQGAVNLFITKAMDGETLELWDGGKFLRDFNYVDDVSEAFLMAMASEVSSGKVYNLGASVREEGLPRILGGNVATIGDLAKIVVKLVDNESKTLDKPYDKDMKALEPGHFSADTSKIKNEIGWSPKTSLEDGIRRTIEFYKEGKNREIYWKREEKLVNSSEEKVIPLGDLKRRIKKMRPEFNEAVSRVLSSGWFILGKELENLEKEFASECGKEYGVGVGNGFDALHLTLRALDVGEGDEVITAVNTAIPTVAAIAASGARPVLVDVRSDSLMDPLKMEEAITRRTKVVIPVHLYGQVCNMDEILGIARRRNLKVVEDCAQSHGASYYGRKTPVGDIGCFSFYPSKNLGALGDAGMIITDDLNLEKKLKLLRHYGQKGRYNSQIPGFNSRLDEIQAALLRAGLKHLTRDIERRIEIARIYDEGLREIVETPVVNEGSKHSYHLYVIRTRDRDGLKERLRIREVGSEVHYPIPIHLQGAYKYLGYNEGDFPVAEKLSKEILSLPIFPELKDFEILKVIEAVKESV